MFTEADRSYSHCKATKQGQTSAREFELSSFSLLWSVLELSSHNGITYVQLTFPTSINLIHITFYSYPKKIVSMVIPKPVLWQLRLATMPMLSNFTLKVILRKEMIGINYEKNLWETSIVFSFLLILKKIILTTVSNAIKICFFLTIPLTHPCVLSKCVLSSSKAVSF